jgi:hypothetical protein
MNQKNLLSIIVLDIVVMLLAAGLIVFRYNTLVEMSRLSSDLAVRRPVAAALPEPISSSSTAAAAATAPAVPSEPETDDVSLTEGLPRNIGFSYRNSRARKVEVIGDFNGWVPKPMIKGKDYKWSISVPISPGEYAYNFVVDGKPIRDPYNTKVCDVGRGFPNSLLKVKSLTDEKKSRE